VRQLRPPFLDDVSAAEASCRACAGARGTIDGLETRCRTGLIGHERSRNYGLEHPVDDPDEDDEDDFDEDDEDGDDEDADEEEPETWQVSD